MLHCELGGGAQESEDVVGVREPEMNMPEYSCHRVNLDEFVADVSMSLVIDCLRSPFI